MNPLPKKITPCPLIDTIIELRFDPIVHQDAIFGLLYSSLKDDYGTVKQLPVLQIPNPIRESDPNLKYNPHYQLAGSGHEFIVQIGPRTISVSILGIYPGWSKFSPRIEDVINRVKKTNVCKNFVRVGIRSINFFENDIYQKINLSISMDNKPFTSNQTTIVTQLPDNDIETRMQISNSTKVVTHGNTRNGSVIDLDTFCNSAFEFETAVEIINRCHAVQKNRFFNLLTTQFLNTLNPEY